MALTPAPDGYPLKLIRDHTTDIIGDKGDLLYGYISLDPETLGPWLRRKLGEEMTEYLIEPGVDELKDILSVVAALAEAVHGIGLEDLLYMHRTDPRGGFYTGRMMLGYHASYDGAGEGD